MKIFDCFMYSDENMLLDLRLNILAQFVDKYVVVEAKYTHDGKPKKLNFNISDFDNLNSISLSKIITIISPLDFLIKQMLLETNENDLCKKLISVLEIEIRDSQKSLKIN